MNSILPDSTSTCVNCGKGGKGNSDGIQLKTCTACKIVKYCSRECQIAHRPQHKKECKKRAAALHDEKLFKQPPQLDDCPICMIPLPTLETGSTYFTCCGKVICCGCVHANAQLTVDMKCAFCRTPDPMDNGNIILDMINKRVAVNEPRAIYHLGTNYDNGRLGLPKDSAKALELWHRAGELGDAKAYHNIGVTYDRGDGVQRDSKKATHYWELAAMLGHVGSRCNLGADEKNTGNVNRAMKHFMIAVRSGDDMTLRNIKKLFMSGEVTKDDYARALRAHQAYVDEIKSVHRDKAAAFSNEYKYFNEGPVSIDEYTKTKVRS